MIENTVLHGDWLVEGKKIPDNSIGLIVTSPPYYNAKKEYALTPGQHEYASYVEYLQHVAAWMREAYRVLEPGRRLVWQIDDLLKSKEFLNCTTSQDSVLIARQLGFIVKTKIIWYDPMNAEGWLPGTYPNGPNVVINWAAEDIWVFQKPDTYKSHAPRYKKLPPELAKYDVMDKEFLIKFARNQVWEIRSESAKRAGHPAPFPEALVEPCIRMWSRPGDVVLDMFAGRGTTLLSAMKWRRKYLGVERKKEYYDLILENILKRQFELMHEQTFLPLFEPPAPDTSLPDEVRATMEQMQLA